MRVATLNLWNTSGDWPARRRVLTDGFKALQPDLVAFQEAVLTERYDQAADLLGDGWHDAQQTEREDDGSGIVIASRWPLGWIREIDLHLTPRTEGFACATLIAEVLAPEPVGPLLLANHLPSWQPRFERERELQAVAAARAIDELAGDPDTHRVLVGCGDHGGPTLDIGGCERLFDQPVDGVWASDHFGLVADLGPPT